MGRNLRRGRAMRRYSIIVREFGSKHEVELLQVNSNPEAIAFVLETKREHHINKYSSVRIVDHGPPADDAVKPAPAEADADDALPPWEDAP
jgi:hypothetical protein